MKLLSLVFVLICIASAFASPFKRDIVKLSPKTRQAVARCNAKVCFALVGSAPITPRQFQDQQFFVIDVIDAIRKLGLDASAIQYGLRIQSLSHLTYNTRTFLDAVASAGFANYSVNFLASGILGCQSELGEGYEPKARKIVLIADGRSTFVGDLRVLSLLSTWSGGEICAIGIGFDSHRRPSPLRSLVEDESRIFELDDYTELGQLIDTMVQQICY